MQSNTVRNKYGFGLLLANSNNSLISGNNFIDNSLSLSYNDHQYNSQAADFANGLIMGEIIENTFRLNYSESYEIEHDSGSSDIYNIETNVTNPGDLTPVQSPYSIPTLNELMGKPEDEENLSLSELILPNIDSRFVIISFLITIIGISSFFYFLMPWLEIRKKLNIDQNQLGSGVTTVFGKKISMFYYMLAQSKHEDTEYVKELKKSISTELFNYKFLLQPIRMAIIKLLYENMELTSVEIKNILDIKWGEYNTHIRALKSKNYIIEREEFIDGSVKHIVTIESKGIDEYANLKEILIKFVDGEEIELENFNFMNKQEDNKESHGFDLDELS